VLTLDDAGVIVISDDVLLTIVGALVVPEIVTDADPRFAPPRMYEEPMPPAEEIKSAFADVIVGTDAHPDEDPPLDDPPEDEPPELDPPLEEPPLDPPELDDATGVVRCTSETVPPT
jgi:hypothetical protein